MAVYKIFPTADASIYSAFPNKNTGLDEILEVAVYNSQNPGNVSLNSLGAVDDVRRSLIRFDSQQINNAIGLIGSSSYSASLKLYLANANNLNTEYSLEAWQLGQSWVMGTGKFNDSPETQNGVSWNYTSGSTPWSSTQYYITPGGGSWTGLYATQSFTYQSEKDVNMDVSNIVYNWQATGSGNYGFIVKYPIAFESSSLNYSGLQFFSVDTHTIYPPTLEIKWDDASYNTGSLSVVSNSDIVVTVGNNTSEFKYGTEKYTFRVNVRDKYPTRTFTTSSIYTNVKALPYSSSWSIVDYKTNDVVIESDLRYTRISCDQNGNYFSVYMNGLEPERYYKLLIKSTLPSGENVEIDNDLIFRIVN